MKLELKPAYKKELLEDLKKTGLIFGKFILSSGKESDFYIDAKKVLLNAKSLFYFCDTVLDFIEKQKPDAVGGIAVGGDVIVGGILSLAYKKGLNIIRGFVVRKEKKEYGTERIIEGDLRKDDRVIMVDDVLTTGQSLLSAIKEVEKITKNIEAVVVLVNRSPNNKLEKKYKLYSCFEIDQIIK